jgi:hypothetical protein
MANKSSQVAPANAYAVGNSGSTGMDPTGAKQNSTNVNIGQEEETKKVSARKRGAWRKPVGVNKGVLIFSTQQCMVL